MRLHTKNLSQQVFNPGIMYCLANVPKPLKNAVSTFWPISSAIDIPTYNLAKFLVDILSPLTVSEFTLKDSFNIAAKIRQQKLSVSYVSMLTLYLLIFLIWNYWYHNEWHWDSARLYCLWYQGVEFRKIRKR